MIPTMRIALALILGLTFLSPAALRADEYDDCVRGGQAVSGRSYDLAIRYCTVVITEPRFTQMQKRDAYLIRGNAYDGKGMGEQAFGDRMAGALIQPAGRENLIERGLAEAAAGQMEAAIATFSEIIRRGARTAEMYYNRGVAQLFLNRAEPAIEDFRESLRLKPDEAVVHHNLGLALMRLARFDDAIASFDRALAINQRFGMAFHDRGHAYLATARRPEALRDFQRARELLPDDPRIARTIRALELRTR
ncbi:MAG: tetratricopeptide repeat protein [Alphaproteobacteria bacterium]|nr:tetratricopeptide repeat protein [Alphaproteobacteria bacterium]